MKYVRHETEGFILFTRSDSVIWHSSLVIRLFKDASKIISAGFVFVKDGLLYCSGGSESLGISSRPDDTDSLRKQLGL